MSLFLDLDKYRDEERKLRELLKVLLPRAVFQRAVIPHESVIAGMRTVVECLPLLSAAPLEEVVFGDYAKLMFRKEPELVFLVSLSRNVDRPVVHIEFTLPRSDIEEFKQYVSKKVRELIEQAGKPWGFELVLAEPSVEPSSVQTLYYKYVGHLSVLGEKMPRKYAPAVLALAKKWYSDLLSIAEALAKTYFKYFNFYKEYLRS